MKKSDSLTWKETLAPYLKDDAEVNWDNPDMPVCPVRNRTPGLEANVRYFGHPEWAPSYFKFVHRNENFRSRWSAATGPWDNKIVVDVGCGPGNVYATLQGKPKLLIGVDVSKGALDLARPVGYQTILADAQDLPFVSGFADIVVVNATLHHCDDMEKTLKEAARLVAPGGVLVTDHDPQFTAWNFRGLAKLAWNFRLTVYLWMQKGFHRSVEEQSVALASEIHHEPGRGLRPSLFEKILPPLGFDMKLCPHNHNVGESALRGDIGRSSRKYRLAQLFSGLNPNSSEAALSILCRAERRSLAAQG